jgi:hypothetical protein
MSTTTSTDVERTKKHTGVGSRQGYSSCDGLELNYSTTK